VKDFGIDKYYKELEIMNKIIEKEGDIKFILHRFYMIIEKV
jgi:hypothetical protein